METEPAAETAWFIKKLEDGQNPHKKII